MKKVPNLEAAEEPAFGVELRALEEAYKAIAPLDDAAKRRVMKYLLSRFRLGIVLSSKGD